MRKFYYNALLYLKENFGSTECHEKFNNYLVMLIHEIKGGKK